MTGRVPPVQYVFSEDGMFDNLPLAHAGYLEGEHSSSCQFRGAVA